MLQQLTSRAAATFFVKENAPQRQQQQPQGCPHAQALRQLQQQEQQQQL